MAQSTPLRDLGDVSSVTFNFLTAPLVNVYLVFYDGAGDPLPASAGGARDVFMETSVPAYSGPASDPERLPTSFVAPDSTTATATIQGGTWRTANLGAGSSSLRLTPSGGSDAAGAVSYALQVGNAPGRS